MKLNSAQVQRALDQFEASVIPDENPAIAELNDVFGEHTFFLDQHGLNIVEPVEAAEPAAECARVVNLGNWRDDRRSRRRKAIGWASTGAPFGLIAPGPRWRSRRSIDGTDVAPPAA